MKITKASVSSSDASDRTIRRQSGELNACRDAISGGASLTQLEAEIRTQTPEDQQALLVNLEFKVHIPALTGLSLKVDLWLPWKKMRDMRR